MSLSMGPSFKIDAAKLQARCFCFIGGALLLADKLSIELEYTSTERINNYSFGPAPFAWL